MSDPIVTVKQGSLKGKTSLDFFGREFYSFQGIPYAKPPIGDLRFKTAQPAEPWECVRDATIEGSECYSKDVIRGTFVGSEDCLFLNVFTQQLPQDTQQLKPVMVYIHGGGFVWGSSKSEVYGPEYLISEDIVLVTLNYRLGVLGFLSLEDPSLGVPGNAGLKDMVLALKWVQENIKYFNGNPDNVTIFGESAGGASVHLLVLSPMAKGLFHKAILQSGCALNTWASGGRNGRELASLLGVETDDEKEILRVLLAASKEDLHTAQSKMERETLASRMRTHGPVIEKVTEHEPAFLSQDPLTTMKSGNYNKVPFLIGFTNREGLLYDMPIAKVHRIKDFTTAIPFRYKVDEKKVPEVADKIKRYYFGDVDPQIAESDKHTLLNTDQFFIREINHTVKMHSAFVPVYYYRMDIETKLNVFKNIIGGLMGREGVCHGDDLGYLFKSSFTPEVLPGSAEQKAVKRFVKLWTNFAKTGNPNPPQIMYLIPVVWQPATPGELNYLAIDTELSTGIGPEAERMSFWQSLFPNDLS